MIVDDEYIVREGMKKTVDWESYGIEIVGEADDGVKGFEMAKILKPDIILTDVRMQSLGGLDLLKQIKDAELDCEVIIISGYEDFDYVREALKSGAFSYLVKPVDNDELIETVLKAGKKLSESRHTQKYFERLSGELNSIKRHFLRELIMGTIVNDKAINDNLEFYKIDLDFNNCVALYFKVDDSGFADSDNSPDHLRHLENILTELVNNDAFQQLNQKAVFFNIGENEFAAILNIDDSYNISFVRTVFKECALKFETEAKRNICIGIGSKAASLSEIKSSFQDAKKCFQNQDRIKGLSIVIAFEDINNFGYKKEIQGALRYICENYANPITVDSAANEFFISPSYLMHLFKDELGKTFNECLTEYRIITAKELLVLNKYKIYEVSNMVGYKDVKYFSQIFKKYCGVTPSEYAKNP
jgi:two-component system response regulator YesN